MFDELKNLLKNSRSDYYNHKVSCIAVCIDGTKFNGVNIETSSPAAGICAERNAIYSAISNGYNGFTELHIMVDRDKYSYPCFVCRQALSDFLNDNTVIYLYSNIKLENKMLLGDLLSYRFSIGDKE